MQIDAIQRAVNQAVRKFYANDSELFSLNVSEWAMAHRIAVYLECEFHGWNIDCEYNRQSQGVTNNPKVNDEGKITRPDITVHRRGLKEPEHNLVVIELKIHEDEPDRKKAMKYTDKPSVRRPFQYQYGLALSLLPKPKFTWYSNGRKYLPTSKFASS